MKAHYEQPRVGHYGVFNGSRWRAEIAPRVLDFIRSNRGGEMKQATSKPVQAKPVQAKPVQAKTAPAKTAPAKAAAAPSPAKKPAKKPSPKSDDLKAILLSKPDGVADDLKAILSHVSKGMDLLDEEKAKAICDQIKSEAVQA